MQRNQRLASAALVILLAIVGIGCEVVGEPVLSPTRGTVASAQPDAGDQTDAITAMVTDDRDLAPDTSADALEWDEGCGGAAGPEPSTPGGPPGCCIMPGIPGTGSLAFQVGCADGTYCRSFRDGPADPEATCVSMPAIGATDVLSTGTVFDVGSILVPPYLPKPLAGVRVSMLGGVQAALGPFQKGLVSAVSDARGRFECVIPAANQPVAIVAVQQKEGYFPSITGVISNKNGYESLPANHDYFIVPTSVVDTLNTKLVKVQSMAKLGAGGGVIVIVRDPTRGPVAGVRILSQNAASKAKVAYLQDDGSVVADSAGTSTGSAGIGIITSVPLTGERFYVQAKDGTNVYPWANSGGAVPDVIFTMVMNVQCGTHC